MGEQQLVTPVEFGNKEVLILVTTFLVVISVISTSIFFLSNNETNEVNINPIFSGGDPLLQGEGMITEMHHNIIYLLGM